MENQVLPLQSPRHPNTNTCLPQSTWLLGWFMAMVSSQEILCNVPPLNKVSWTNLPLSQQDLGSFCSILFCLRFFPLEQHPFPFCSKGLCTYPSDPRLSQIFSLVQVSFRTTTPPIIRASPLLSWLHTGRVCGLGDWLDLGLVGLSLCHLTDLWIHKYVTSYSCYHRWGQEHHNISITMNCVRLLKPRAKINLSFARYLHRNKWSTLFSPSVVSRCYRFQARWNKKKNTVTMFSNIKIEQFIQDTEYDLLILSWNKWATTHKVILFFFFSKSVWGEWEWGWGRGQRGRGVLMVLNRMWKMLKEDHVWLYVWHRQ